MVEGTNASSSFLCDNREERAMLAQKLFAIFGSGFLAADGRRTEGILIVSRTRRTCSSRPVWTWPIRVPIMVDLCLNEGPLMEVL